MYFLNITEIAEYDIIETIKYIASELKNITAANNLLDEIEKHEESLENNPYIYPNVPDEYLAQKGLKFVIIRNYLLFFSINEENKIINVIRFLYGRRDWKNILKDTEII